MFLLSRSWNYDIQIKLHWGFCYHPKKSKQHPWRWPPTFHSNWHCIWKSTLFLKKAGMKILSICLKTTKSTWLELYNICLPNTSTQHNSFDPLIKLGPSSLILGDLNGHCQMWDSFQPQGQCGDKILDWVLDNDLHFLSDGSATWTSRITGNDSTPNISLCESSWSAKTSSRLAEPIRSFDHVPILIEINQKICYQSVISRTAW